MQREETVTYENTVPGKGNETDEIITTIGEDKNCHSDNELLLNRMKCLVCVIFAMLIVLYVVVFVAIGFFVLYTPEVQVDGNWVKWSQWTPCDVTCGKGSQSRFRTCTNPAPTTNGAVCVGNITEISICQLPKCLDQSGHRVSFSARLADNAQTVRQNEVVVFNEVSNNDMDGYDSKTGIFKAPLSGVYLFMYFIEIDGAYGIADLRLNNKPISRTTLYGMFSKIAISGINNTVTFDITKTDKGTVTDHFRCMAEDISISGIRNNVTINQLPALDTCPYKDGVKATGGNSVVIPVHTGDQVWIQNSEIRPISVRSYGSTFTGVLLT